MNPLVLIFIFSAVAVWAEQRTTPGNRTVHIYLSQWMADDEVRTLGSVFPDTSVAWARADSISYDENGQETRHPRSVWSLPLEQRADRSPHWTRRHPHGMHLEVCQLFEEDAQTQAHGLRRVVLREASAGIDRETFIREVAHCPVGPDNACTSYLSPPDAIALVLAEYDRQVEE